jgi:DNA mismatch endonuclease (patch repair protein)
MNYWRTKREKNRQRDRAHLRSLRAADWRVLVVWECWTRDLARLRKRLVDFLD